MVSVIIPVYNCREYLPRCLESVAGQSLPELEILLVDDGSRDGSGELCDRFAAGDSRFRVIHIPNGGVSNARNTGLAQARGEYIAFVDADDYVEPEYIRCMLSHLERTGADVACCGFLLHRPDGAVPVHGTGNTRLWEGTEALVQLVDGKVLEPGVWGKLFRRELLEPLRFLTAIRFNEDFLFVLQAFHRARQVAWEDVPLYHYVLHPNSATTAAPVLERAQHCMIAAEKAAAMDTPVKELLLRKQYLGYLEIYNSLLYGKGEEFTALKKELRQKIRSSGWYRTAALGKKALFYYWGIRCCPGVYGAAYRSIKKLLPDRRVFRL